LLQEVFHLVLSGLIVRQAEIQNLIHGRSKHFYKEKNMSMCSAAVATPDEVSGYTLDEEAVKFQEQIIHGNSAQVLDHRPGEREIQHETSVDTPTLEELTEKKNYWGFLEGTDAMFYLRFSNTPAPTEKPIDTPSLHSKLSSLMPKDRQLERRTRKLAWHLLKGRSVATGWDVVLLSELTPAESCMSDEDFVGLYPEQVKTPTKKGGRPRKYQTATARRKGHAERQQRYRAKARCGRRCDENPLAAH